MVLNEGSYDMDAIHLFMEDIDSLLTKDAPADLKQRYTDFLSTMADSCIARYQVDQALTWITKAAGIADNPTALNEKRKNIITTFTKQYFDQASAAFIEGKENKDADMAVKAEYYVGLVMVYDSTFPGAAQLLSEIRKANVNTYSGYAKVVEGKLDKRVNKFDILLAVTSPKPFTWSTITVKNTRRSLLQRSTRKSSIRSMKPKISSSYSLESRGKSRSSSMKTRSIIRRNVFSKKPSSNMLV
jgi:hypothetical protein